MWVAGWGSNQMQSYGLGWRTFEYDKDGDGLAKVVTIRSTATTDDLLGPDCTYLSDMAYKDFLKSLPAKEQLLRRSRLTAPRLRHQMLWDADPRWAMTATS